MDSDSDKGLVNILHCCYSLEDDIEMKTEKSTDR